MPTQRPERPHMQSRPPRKSSFELFRLALTPNQYVAWHVHSALTAGGTEGDSWRLPAGIWRLPYYYNMSDIKMKASSMESPAANYIQSYDLKAQKGIGIYPHMYIHTCTHVYNTSENVSSCLQTTVVTNYIPKRVLYVQQPLPTQGMHTKESPPK